MIPVLDRRLILVALAGPNGAGKSTFYRAHLAASGLQFVNADQLALRLKVDPYRAAELAGQIRLDLVARKESFIFETVFSDPVGDKAAFLSNAEAAGYTVVLFFIGIDGIATSQERVAMRVLKGGHDVPDTKIVSRYSRTMENLRRALASLSNVFVYDNSNLAAPYLLVARVARVENGKLAIIESIPEWLAPLLPVS